MSLQVFLQARLLGAKSFLAVQAAEKANAASDALGRGAWLTLLGEVLPRALLAELKLSRMLLGSSSAEQFLLVLAEEDIGRANEFLTKAAATLANVSSGTLRLVWATTENLGAWPIVRKRLDDALAGRTCCPLDSDSVQPNIFEPFTEPHSEALESAFPDFAREMISAETIGWDPGSRLLLAWNAGVAQWRLGEQSAPEEDTVLFPRRMAMDEAGGELASPHELAERAEGADRWGVLAGDVDHFEIQLRRAGSIEEHIHLSALFKEFFAGELAVLCALPEFWRKVTVLYRGGDDFAVFGSWDALILLAREIERLFSKFVEGHLTDLPGVEAKTISMALVLAPADESAPGPLLAEAAVELHSTKSSELGSLHIFGRTLEWKRLHDAEELKSGLVRLVREYRFPAAYLNDLAAVYRETTVRTGRRGRAQRIDKPWRTYLRLSRVIPPPRGKEQANVRNAVITNLIGKRTAALKLRPSGRVGLEWARLEASA